MKHKSLILIIAILILALLLIIFFSIYKPVSISPTTSSSFQPYDLSPYFKTEGSSSIYGDDFDVEVVTENEVSTLYIDHQLIYDATNPFLKLDATMYYYPNYLVYTESGAGTSIVYIYSMEDKMSIPYSYISDYDLTIESVQIKEEGIFVDASRVFENTIVVGSEVQSIDSCEKVQTYGDEIVSGRFVKKYDKKNGFSDFEKVSLIKLKELEKYQSLCQ